MRIKGIRADGTKPYWGGGILLGPFLGGISADSALGVQSPYLLCAVAVAIAILIEMFILFKNSRHQAYSH